MKSSTLHRSNLTKERMELLREIKAQKNVSNDTAPGIYVRPTKEKELDVLWQTFKVNQKKEKSVNIYMVVGFVCGAFAMFFLTALISFAAHVFTDGAGNYRTGDLKQKVVPLEKVSASESKNGINFLPPDNAKTVNAKAAAPVATEQYTIKSGDTLDKIAVRFYGKYDSDKIAKIAKANNITNPHKISIGQVITIPME